MKHLLFLVLFSLFSYAHAQLPNDLRSEQVVIALGRTSVAQGDTLEVEGQVTCMASDRFMPYSNYLYLECISSSDSVLCRQKLSCRDKGYFSSKLPIASEWASGTYYLRAYTRLMMNFSADAFAIQPFRVEEEKAALHAESPFLYCDLVVVGGDLHSDTPQHVAISTHDSLGFPLAKHLFLFNEAKDTLATVTTSKNGLALLSFIPQKDQSYYLKAADEESLFPLPQIENDSLQVLGYLQGNRLSFQINGTTMNETLRLFTYDRLNGLEEYGVNGRTSGIIKMNPHSEVVSLFLTDKDGNLKSEATMYSPLSRDSLRLAFPHTLAVGDSLVLAKCFVDSSQHVFLSIFPDEEPIMPIESALKYLSDYQSLLSFPTGIYAYINEKTANEDLKAWLASASFKRFEVSEALQRGENMYHYMPEFDLMLSGEVYSDGHPQKGGKVLAYSTNNNYMYDAPLNKQGRFSIAVDDFSEGERFFVEAKTPKGKSYLFKYHFYNDTLSAASNISMSLSLPLWARSITRATIKSGESTFTDDEYSQLHYAEVKARVTAQQAISTEQFYRKDYIGRDRIETFHYITLEEIVRSIIGMQVRDSCIVCIRRGAYSNIPLLIDGTRCDWPNEKYMSAEEIESVEYMPPYKALPYISAMDGCIFVKTRGYGSSKGSTPPLGIVYMPIGLSPFSDSKYHVPRSWIATKAGKYNLYLNVITDTNVKSYIWPLEVIP